MIFTVRYVFASSSSGTAVFIDCSDHLLPLPQSIENYIELKIGQAAWQEFTVAGWVNYSTDKRPAVFSYAKKGNPSGNANEMVLWFRTECEFRITVGDKEVFNTSLCGNVKLGMMIELA